MHRLMCYINSTLHIKMSGWIADPIEDLELCVFSDADWAGEKTTYKSTTRSFAILIGPKSIPACPTVPPRQKLLQLTLPSRMRASRLDALGNSVEQA